MSDYKYDLLEMNCDDALSSDKSALNIKSGSEKNKAHYIGHRARLRQKLLNNGADSIPDYELLEMILTIALPRMDVKPLAKKLLDKFGNFAEVINASPDDLSKISGVKETTIAVLKIIQGAIVRVLKTELKQMPVINNWDKLIDYCRLNIAYEPNEQFRVLYLDSKLKLISDELQQQGTINYAVVYPREVVKQAVSNGATGIILVHNHPSGDPTPSQSDIDLTKKLFVALQSVDVSLFDHIIIGKGQKYISFKNSGLF